jgi:hypothetical protein
MSQMTINANTKIGTILKQHPDALEAIVSISPKFIKLRNPLLRKVMAGRTTIAMASKIGGCTVDDFFTKLEPLGFENNKRKKVQETNLDNKPIPAFMRASEAGKIIELDVRPIIETGKDPLDIIAKTVKNLSPAHILKIVNSFEPTPLIHLLGKQGFESYVERISADLVNSYFHKIKESPIVSAIPQRHDATGWDEILDSFKDKLKIVDVRALEMPLPMHTILDALKTLPQDHALFVYHKRIPVFLLPELEEQQFSYRIKEISDSEVHLLIYKP